MQLESSFQPFIPSQEKRVEVSEEKLDLLEAVASIKRMISSEFYADPNKRILPEFYQDSSDEGQQRLEHLRRNKFRKGWFTALLGDVQLACRLLDNPAREYLAQKVKELNKEVLATPEVTPVLIAKAEGLARVAVQLSQEKLDG